VFISTDKACSPINTYGMSKAISEQLMIEKSVLIPNKKFVCVRYGNVLNSRGSIIPLLHKRGKDPNIHNFVLTDENMTRFVMTLEQSVNLIEHAIIHGDSGDIIVSELISMKVKDLLEIFSEKYNKPIIKTGIRPGEKLLESLINETQSLRLIKKEKYYYIKSIFYCKKNEIQNIESYEIKDYNSKINPLTKEELKMYLNKLNLL
jgi:UDP-glucose 4-epimerase